LIEIAHRQNLARIGDERRQLISQSLLVRRQRNPDSHYVNVVLEGQQSLALGLVRIWIVSGAVRDQNRHLPDALSGATADRRLVHLGAKRFERRGEIRTAVRIGCRQKDAFEVGDVEVGVEVELNVRRFVEVEKSNSDGVGTDTESICDVGVELKHCLPVLIIEVVNTS